MTPRNGHIILPVGPATGALFAGLAAGLLLVAAGLLLLAGAAAGLLLLLVAGAGLLLLLAGAAAGGLVGVGGSGVGVGGGAGKMPLGIIMVRPTSSFTFRATLLGA